MSADWHVQYHLQQTKTSVAAAWRLHAVWANLSRNMTPLYMRTVLFQDWLSCRALEDYHWFQSSTLRSKTILHWLKASINVLTTQPTLAVVHALVQSFFSNCETIWAKPFNINGVKINTERMEPHLYRGQAILTNQIVRKQKEWVVHPVVMVYILLSSYISLSLRYSYSYFPLLKKCFGWLARLAFCTIHLLIAKFIKYTVGTSVYWHR